MHSIDLCLRLQKIVHLYGEICFRIFNAVAAAAKALRRSVRGRRRVVSRYSTRIMCDNNYA